MDLVLRSLVGFLVVVCISWCGLSVYTYARYGWNIKKLRETGIGRLMEKTAYGTMAAAGLVVAAALGRLVAGWLGV